MKSFPCADLISFPHTAKLESEEKIIQKEPEPEKQPEYQYVHKKRMGRRSRVPLLASICLNVIAENLSRYAGIGSSHFRFKNGIEFFEGINILPIPMRAKMFLHLVKRNLLSRSTFRLQLSLLIDETMSTLDLTVCKQHIRDDAIW
jgi:hypothetical protein